MAAGDPSSIPGSFTLNGKELGSVPHPPHLRVRLTNLYATRSVCVVVFQVLFGVRVWSNSERSPEEVALRKGRGRGSLRAMGTAYPWQQYPNRSWRKSLDPQSCSLRSEGLRSGRAVCLLR